MAQIGETELDAGALARALWRRAWLVILLTALAAAGTYYALGFVEPLYTADTSILIEARESPLTRTREQAGAPTLEFDESAIQSQVQVLRSREIANSVIDRLDLTRRPEFDPATRPSLVGSIMVLVGAKRHPADDTIRQRVMESYFERLSVYPVQKSRVIAVEFSAPNPSLAAEVANAIAEAFVDLQQDAKRETAVAATAWLEQEIDRLRDRVAEAEQAVSEYRANNELFDVDQTASLSTQQLSDLNAELARARAARAEAESRAALVASLLAEGGSLEASQEVLESPLIQRLQERQVALRSQIAELSTTFLPGHPRIRALEGQLANLEGQIRQEAQKVQASLQTAARVAAAREESLVASLEEAKVDVSRSDTSEIELRALEREAAAQRDLLESLLARYREALARTDTSYLPADARIISRAVAPGEPSFPKKAIMSLAAGLATFLIVTAILLLREFTSGRAFRLVPYGYAGVPAGWPGGYGGAAFAPVLYAPPKQGSQRRPEATAFTRPERPRRGGTRPDLPAVVTPPAPARPGADGMAEPAAAAKNAPDLFPDREHAGDVAPTDGLAAGTAAIVDEPVRPLESELDSRGDHAPERDRGIGSSAAGEQPEGIHPEDVPLAVAAVGTAEPNAWHLAAADMDSPAVPTNAAPAPIVSAAVLTGADPDGPAADTSPSTDEAELAPAPAEPVETPLPAAETASPLAETVLPAEVVHPLAAAAALATDAPSRVSEGDRPGTAELAEILASQAVRVAVFAGAQGGEGAGAIAFSAARHAAEGKLRFVLVDVGRTPSGALGGYEQPGLGELLGGEAAFGEVIQRDDDSPVHFIPMGGLGERPSERLHIVIGALTHTYDKVVVVADSVADWPHEQVRPDLIAIICGPGSTDELRGDLYDAALQRGAASAIIVRYASDGPNGTLEHTESAAA